MPNKYNIDFDRLIKQLTPNIFYKIIWAKWLRVLLFTIVQIYNSFLKYRKTKLYELGITPQVCYLEKLLNDRFDFTLRGIYIVDGQDKPAFYLYRRAENKPKYFFKRSETKPQILYTRGESGALTDDFVIMVPMVVVFDFNEMAALVRAYKLPGTKFKIQRF